MNKGLRGKNRACADCKGQHKDTDEMYACRDKYARAKEQLDRMLADIKAGNTEGALKCLVNVASHQEKVAEDRAEELAEGTVTPETLSTPTYEQFMGYYQYDPSRNCEAPGNECWWADSNFGCWHHMWQIYREDYCWYKGKVHLRRSTKLINQLGLDHPVAMEHWQTEKAMIRAHVFMDRKGREEDIAV